MYPPRINTTYTRPLVEFASFNRPVAYWAIIFFAISNESALYLSNLLYFDELKNRISAGMGSLSLLRADNGKEFSADPGSDPKVTIWYIMNGTVVTHLALVCMFVYECI